MCVDDEAAGMICRPRTSGYVNIRNALQYFLEAKVDVLWKFLKWSVDERLHCVGESPRGGYRTRAFKRAMATHYHLC